jgi:hypothetical protein
MRFEVFKYSLVDDEIEAVIVYYESISYSLGLRFEKEIESAFDKLETSADYYFNLQDNIHRRIPIEGFPYALIYCIENHTQVIVKILFPQKEDPAKLWARLGSF